MPAALANALSSAAQTDFNQTPITPELIWNKKGMPK
jgi:CO/xanthine dehydrogenase Mo-binding subunit